MSQSPFTSGKYALAICDVCGIRRPFNELRFVPQTSIGSPGPGDTGIKACIHGCWDPPHPQSMLPLAVEINGADPQQLDQPRPDIFPIAYPVAYSLPGAIYASIPALSIAHGFSGKIYAKGVFVGYSVTVQPPSGITVNSFSLLNPTQVLLNISVSSLMVPGTYVMSITGSDGEVLNGQLIIT